jgi:hypothetical protein
LFFWSLLFFFSALFFVISFRLLTLSLVLSLLFQVPWGVTLICLLHVYPLFNVGHLLVHASLLELILLQPICHVFIFICFNCFLISLLNSFLISGWVVRMIIYMILIILNLLRLVLWSHVISPRECPVEEHIFCCCVMEYFVYAFEVHLSSSPMFPYSFSVCMIQAVLKVAYWSSLYYYYYAAVYLSLQIYIFRCSDVGCIDIFNCYIFLSGGGTGFWTQGFILTEQGLYCLSHTSSPFFSLFFFFLRWESHELFSQAGSWSSHDPPDLNLSSSLDYRCEPLAPGC